MKRTNACNFLVLFLLLFSSKFTAAQKTDSTERVREFGGNISVTNNGISFIPSFSLEKPALITEFSMVHRLYFEPQLRFALE
ncbi:MAG: hypothetical protein GYA22_07040, partial [Bacteroidales bacterium]|nr:hypothetical protein [Bacteroidales bacterium]